MVSAEANRLHFIVFVEKENIRGIWIIFLLFPHTPQYVR
jgi:hypothetical protein